VGRWSEHQQSIVGLSAAGFACIVGCRGAFVAAYEWRYSVCCGRRSRHVQQMCEQQAQMASRWGSTVQPGRAIGCAQRDGVFAFEGRLGEGVGRGLVLSIDAWVASHRFTPICRMGRAGASWILAVVCLCVVQQLGSIAAYIHRVRCVLSRGCAGIC
jgi:hypothetical protein